jgi:hypothetical protein
MGLGSVQSFEYVVQTIHIDSLQKQHLGSQNMHLARLVLSHETPCAEDILMQQHMVISCLEPLAMAMIKQLLSSIQPHTLAVEAPLSSNSREISTELCLAAKATAVLPSCIQPDIHSAVQAASDRSSTKAT